MNSTTATTYHVVVRGAYADGHHAIVDVTSDLMHPDGQAAAIAGWVAHHENVPNRQIGGVGRIYDDLDPTPTVPPCRVYINAEGWAVAVATDGTGPVIGQSRGIVTGLAAEEAS